MLKGSSPSKGARLCKKTQKGNANENRWARTSRVAAEDNRELNCFWSGNSLCSLQYVAGKGVPLFIGSNAKFACTGEREPPSELWTISDVKKEKKGKKKKQRPRLSSNAIHLCASVHELRNFGACFRFRIRFISLSWYPRCWLFGFGFSEWPKLAKVRESREENEQLCNDVGFGLTLKVPKWSRWPIDNFC